METTRHYREGGWGWAVVLSAFMAEFINTGTLKAFGILITAMKEDFETDLWVIGSINSLHFGVIFIMTPLASAVALRTGGRCVVCFGGIIYGLGLVMSSVSSHVAILAVTLVMIAGSGAACTNEITRAEMAFYFHEKYSVASFVVYAGLSIGMVVYGPATQVLLHTYGWRGAMLILGGVGFNLTWAGMLLRRPTGVYGTIPTDDFPADDNQTTHLGPEDPPAQSPAQNTPKKPPAGRCDRVVAAFGLDVLLNYEFMLIAGTRMCYCLSVGGILVYLVPNGLSVGLSSSEASFLTVAYGVGSLAGLSLAALVLHRKIVSFHLAATIAASVATVASALVPLISTFTGQMVNTFVVAAGVHAFIQVVSVMTRFLPFDDDKFVTVLGWLGFLGGVAIALGDTLSGWLYDITRSFKGTFFVLSGALAVGLLFILMDFLKTRSNNKRFESSCK